MMEFRPEARLIDVRKLARILDLAPQSIRNQLCAGYFPIPAKKVNGALRFDLRDVMKYLDGLKPLTKPVNPEKISGQRG
jgi:hypothetical protein